MKLTMRLAVTVATACVAAAVIVGIVSGFAATDTAAAFLRSTIAVRLQATSENKVQQVAEYFDLKERQLNFLAQQATTAIALERFALGMQGVKGIAGDEPDPEALARVEAYYRGALTEAYEQRNSSAAPSFRVADYLQALSPAAIRLQDVYLASNPHPVGQKQRFDGPVRGISYDD